MSNQPEGTYDVVVLGTGAAGMTAALAASVAGARVGLFEKAPTVGGTTAVSGGVVWIPAHTIPVDGEILTKAAAKEYLDSVSLGYMDDELVEAFIDSGQPMIDFVESNSPVRFEIVDGFPDYYPERPGGRPGGGRSLNPSPFPYDELGEWASRVTQFPVDSTSFGLDAETRARLRANTDQGAADALAEVDGRFMGAGLIGGLLKGLLDRDVTPFTGYRARDLVLKDNTVTGVTFEHNGESVTIDTAAVVIATGGFEWDEELVKSFLRGPMVGPVSPPYNEGDGLKMAMKAGAQLGNMGDAWWTPVIKVPGDTWNGRARNRSFRNERTRPRSIMVNALGKRFANEASNYNSLGQAFHVFDPELFAHKNIPAWIIVDEVHFRRYGLLGVPSGGDAPEWFNRSETVEELAEKTGIDVDGLRETLDSWNAQVAEGVDRDFARGKSAHDGWSGDGTGKTTAEKTLGPIDSPPYYAISVHSGSLGTKGGPKVDVNGEVLHIDGGVIGGLYAAGNAMAGVTGQAYGGGGGTLGPAMVWGFRAGTHAAEQRLSAPSTQSDASIAGAAGVHT